MMLTGPISEHFTWSEAVRTEHRTLLVRNAEALAVSPSAQTAVRAVAETLLEPLRAHFGRPVMVHSWFRCPDLNAAIGGSATSQHPKGEAVDFHVAGVPLVDVFDWIRHEGPPFGQVILEGKIPSWVHWSLGAPWRPAARCGEALRWDGVSYSVVR
jgi:zinc D-Ala-D-Ala carboxypeptidase